MMYSINYSFKIDHSVLDDFLSWLQDDFIQKVINENHFSGHHLFKLLGHDDEHGTTMVIQFQADSRAILNAFIQKQQQVNNLLAENWQERVLFFHTILERID